MWIIAILFILAWGIAEEISLTHKANKYHQSEEYQYQQWLWKEVTNNTILKDDKDKKK